MKNSQPEEKNKKEELWEVWEERREVDLSISKVKDTIYQFIRDNSLREDTSGQKNGRLIRANWFPIGFLTLLPFIQSENFYIRFNWQLIQLEKSKTQIQFQLAFSLPFKKLFLSLGFGIPWFLQASLLATMGFYLKRLASEIPVIFMAWLLLAIVATTFPDILFDQITSKAGKFIKKLDNMGSQNRLLDKEKTGEKFLERLNYSTFGLYIILLGVVSSIVLRRAIIAAIVGSFVALAYSWIWSKEKLGEREAKYLALGSTFQGVLVFPIFVLFAIGQPNYPQITSLFGILYLIFVCFLTTILLYPFLKPRKPFENISKTEFKGVTKEGSFRNSTSGFFIFGWSIISVLIFVCIPIVTILMRRLIGSRPLYITMSKLDLPVWLIWLYITILVTPTAILFGGLVTENLRSWFKTNKILSSQPSLRKEQKKNYPI